MLEHFFKKQENLNIGSLTWAHGRYLPLYRHAAYKQNTIQRARTSYSHLNKLSNHTEVNISFFVHHFWIMTLNQGSEKYPFYVPCRWRFGNCELLINCASFRGPDLFLAFSKQATIAILLSSYLRSSGKHGLGLPILKSE